MECIFSCVLVLSFLLSMLCVCSLVSALSKVKNMKRKQKHYAKHSRTLYSPSQRSFSSIRTPHHLGIRFDRAFTFVLHCLFISSEGNTDANRTKVDRNVSLRWCWIVRLTFSGKIEWHAPLSRTTNRSRASPCMRGVEAKSEIILTDI
jgi:hypothetical protein